MKTSRWLFYGLLFPITLLATGWGSSLWWLWVSAAPSKAADTTVRLTIPEGTPLQVIGQQLEATGVIRSSLALRMWLQWLAWKEGDNRSLRAGTYDFTLDRPLPAVVTQLQNGLPIEVRFTIPEGWAIAQIAEYFERKGYFRAADFIAAANPKAVAASRPWLPSNLLSLEGFLFPDTYQLPPAELKPERAIGLMLDRFEEVALPLYKSHQFKEPLSLGDWVTFASIVEKEAVLEAERKTIAGVFSQRLKRNMRLESDPTVEYALKIKQTPEKPLTLEQVKTPSPYNTYVNQGLPPGAIASPGLASLKAVLNPEVTDFLYFVARYDGSHVFSRTLEDHEKALREIDRKIEKNKKP